VILPPLKKRHEVEMTLDRPLDEHHQCALLWSAPSVEHHPMLAGQGIDDDAAVIEKTSVLSNEVGDFACFRTRRPFENFQLMGNSGNTQPRHELETRRTLARDWPTASENRNPDGSTHRLVMYYTSF